MSERLRILMINRSDANRVPGGDVVQLQKTRQALEYFGLSVDLRLADELDGRWDCDLVHIFNIQSVSDSWRACQIAKEKGLPIVLSPIFWEPWAGWYWNNPNLGFVWRWERNLLGKRGYGLYALWRRFRCAASEPWQMQRELLRSADVLLPNSFIEAEHIVRHFRLRSDSIPYHVVPNAIDRHLFDPMPKPSKQIRQMLGCDNFVLEVGRVSPEKNSLGLIEALCNVDVPLVFIGQSSPYDPDYAERCRARGQERGNVRFLEWLPHEELPGLYALAALHALPSWRETPGLASLEAAAAGCRVVSTSLGSAYEYFGEDAWYCHPADPQSVRDAVVAALESDPPKTLRARILQHYTWEAAAQATLEAYREVLL